MSNDRSDSRLTRRAMMKTGGMALAAVWSRKAIPAFAGQQVQNPAQTGKVVLLAPEKSADAAVHSRVENLFWSDVMMEHAGFFVMLMPGQELAMQRAQAETFQRTFQTQYDR